MAAMMSPGRLPGLFLAAALGALGVQQDQVVLQKAAAGDDPVVVLEGCQDPVGFAASGPVDLGEVGPGKCSPALAVFARNHSLMESRPAWTSGRDNVGIVMGPAPRRVEVDLYVASGASDAETWLTNDLSRATTIYDEARTGITFLQHKVVPRDQLTDADMARIGRGCAQVDLLQGSALYDAARINVYLVSSILHDGDHTARGYNCYEPGEGNTNGAPNIVYISVLRHSTTTLAHELGHALGLRGKCGHAGSAKLVKIPGLDSSNVMWTRLVSSSVRKQIHFALGQGYRMNAHANSWANAAGAAVSAPGVEPRQCQSGPDGDAPCLPLAFDLPPTP